MHTVATAPTAPTGHRTGASPTYRLERAVTRTFDGPGAPPNDATRTYLTHRFDVEGRADGRLDTLRGIDYADMACTLLREADIGPVDLTVLAHETPDFSLDRIAAVDAAAATGGAPTMFGVTDAGRLAPFSALRLATLFAGRRGITRVAVVVADQYQLLYGPPSAAEPLYGVATVFVMGRAPDGAAPGAAVRSVVLPDPGDGIVPADRDAALDAAFDRLAGAGPAPVAVLGPGCGAWTPDPARTGGALVRAGAGWPSAALWARVAGMVTDPDRSPVVVLDADEGIGAVAGALL